MSVPPKRPPVADRPLPDCNSVSPETPRSDSATRVWATRPAQQNGQWLEALRARGLQTVELPLLAIEPLREGEAAQAIKNVILDFDQFQKVIFVSQNAVAQAFEWLDTFWPQLPEGVDYFAVGKKTAESVAARGVPVTAAERSMNSDELLALPPMLEVFGEKILICRGRGGLPRLGEVLRQRGAIVRYCELYERCLPADAARNLLKTLRKPDACASTDIVPLFSGETLLNLTQLIGDAGDERRGLHLVVPGKRVAELARARGFETVEVADNASEAAMMTAVESALRDLQARDE